LNGPIDKLVPFRSLISTGWIPRQRAWACARGSGLPTRSNVHHIAQAIAPGSRVIYIDNDPVVLRHQKASAPAENQDTAFVLADATKVDEILAHPETQP
jgi:hypothetical protein